MKSASLSIFDPTMIDGVRDQLAENFAQRIFDVIPDICDCMDFEVDACDSPVEKQQFERASQVLFTRRRELQAKAAESVRRIFDEKLYRLLDGAGRTARLSLDGMTLLADERLDEEIAINHCSRRLKEQCEFELWGLTQRIVAVTGIKHPADNQNPAFTLTFAQALMEAIGSVETNGGVRLVVFKTFGPILLDIVPAVYTAANNELKARGIDIEQGDYYGRPILTPERPTAPLPTQQEIALGAARVNLDLSSSLNEILARSGSSQPLYVEPTGEEAAKRMLATTLHLPVVRSDDEAEVPAWHRDLRSIEAKNNQLPIDEMADGRALHSARRTLQDKLTRDQQVVGDIVTVMFDRLQNDPRMPAQLQASVARLQFPILELALKDRSLLTQVHHPVRKLLDLIAEFGLTLGLGTDDDAKVRSVENIVDGLVQIRGSEPNAFKLAFEQLDNLFYHHEEAALQTDDNLRALERKEAVEFAGRQADCEIALRLQNMVLPVAISSFVQKTWREVLVHDYLYGGPLGKPWKLGLATLDDIVKSLRPSTDETERRRLAKTLPSFIEVLLISPDSCEDSGEQDIVAANFFAELRRAHELALAGKWEDIGGERFVPSADALLSSHSPASPSALLASMGLACGDWIETRDFGGTRRWRLNWVTSIMGTCVFKHYESNTTRNMSCDELRDRLSSGDVQRVRGLGMADEILSTSFETVSRKARREEALLAVRTPSDANRGASNITHRWGPSAPTVFPPTQNFAML